MFPLCRIIGCRFHLSQSWYCKILNLQLITNLKRKLDNDVLTQLKIDTYIMM